ncbi:hypothetical protein BGZ46_003464 [Entomortierella lignicola]|nr:hypothetical protein BGZ46_003464 [Entomortierella lignicola]
MNFYYGTTDKSTWTPEIIAGAAAFEVMRCFEKYEENRKYKFSKERFAGVATAEVDRLFETKGLDFIDREKTMREAIKNAGRIYDVQYAN